MSYVAPRTWTTSELATAAMFNENRDNIIDLNARDNVTSDYTATNNTSTSATYESLANNPTVSVTTGTIALVGIHAQMGNNTSGNGARMSFAISGATTIAAADAWCIAYISSANNVGIGLSGVFVMSGLTAGLNTFTAKYRRDLGGTAFFEHRRIWVKPATKLS